MAERHKSPVAEAVDQFLSTPTSVTQPSLSGRVPQGLKVILKEISRDLKGKTPERLYTAAQIADIAKYVYNHKGEAPPEILGNIRAFGRFLQGYPQITGFEATGSTGNRRTYKAKGAGAYTQPPLDS